MLELPPSNEDELAGVIPIESSGTPIPTPVLSLAPTSAPVITPAVVPSLDKKLFKQFIKVYLETQVPSQTEVDSEPSKQPLKTRFPDFYYRNPHIDCYQFCQQFKDYFETAKAKGPNKILFEASFLYGLITQQWFQHKRRRDKAVPMT